MKKFTTSILLCIILICEINAQVYTDSTYDISSLQTSFALSSWYEEPNTFLLESSLNSYVVAALAVSSSTGKAACYEVSHTVLINAEIGEIILFNIFDDAGTASYTSDQNLCARSLYSVQTKGSLASEIEIDDKTSVFQIQSDDYYAVYRLMVVSGSVYSESMWTTEEFYEHTELHDDEDGYYLDSTLISRFPEDYTDLSFSVQKIGKFESFTLQPVDDVTYPTLDDYFATKNFSSISSSDYIISQLSSDIECVAIDTYGQRIYLLCPALTWSVDIDAGTATYTPYFTPRNYDTDWILDNSIECSFSNSANETTKSLLLWSSNAISNTTADKITVIGSQNSIVITNNPGVEIYNIAGRLIYKSTDAIVNVPQGIYIVVAEGQTEKVIVK